MDGLILSTSPLHAVTGVATPLLFPSLAAGLACYLLVLEGLFAATRNEVFRALHGFWFGIFGVCLVLGYAAVLALGRTLGWAWTGAELAMAIGAPAALAAGLALGRRRIGAPAHAMAMGLMAAALLAMMLWLVWLDGQARGLDGALYERFVRTANGAFLATSLGVGAVSAWRLLRRPEEAASIMGLRMSVGMLAITGALRLVSTPAAGPAQIGPAAIVATLIGLASWAGWLVWRRGGPERSRSFLRACLTMGFVGLAAILAGWMTGGASLTDVVGAGEGSPSGWLKAGLAGLFAAGGILILRLVARGPRDPAALADPLRQRR